MSRTVTTGLWITALMLVSCRDAGIGGECSPTDVACDASPRVVSVSSGAQHTMMLGSDGTLWAMGSNAVGQLGDGPNTNSVRRPRPVQVMSGVSSASAGFEHTVIVGTDGALLATGRNWWGQLGDGTNGIDNRRYTPVQVMSGVVSASAGFEHTVIVLADGTLWATGWNVDGQLGDGTTDATPTPVQVMSEVAAASAGRYHSMILKTDGTLWATGYSRYGQLGFAASEICLLDDPCSTTPVQVTSGVQSVSAGRYHTMIVQTDGTLWATGRNEVGQLGVPASETCAFGDNLFPCSLTPLQVTSGVASVSAGGYHTTIVTTDGTLWAMGRNDYGQLGVATSETCSVGENTYPCSTVPVQVMGGVAASSAGLYHTMIVKANGTVWGVGRNDDGQLGDGSTTDRATPVEVIP